MVKCADCGYFAVRNKDDQGLVAPGLFQRETGHPPTIPEPSQPDLGDPTYAETPILETWPICSLGAASLDSEMRGYVPPDAPPLSAATINAARQVVHKQRDCLRFTPWIPALTPKEHLDMANVELNRGWQERQVERDRQWRKEDNRRMALWGVAGTVLGVLLSAIVQLIMSRAQPPVVNVHVSDPRAQEVQLDP